MGHVVVLACGLRRRANESKFVPKAPWSLVILLAGLAASAVLMLPERGVAVVGAVPCGIREVGLGC